MSKSAIHPLVSVCIAAKGNFKKAFGQKLCIGFTLTGDVQGMIRVTGRMSMVLYRWQ